MSAPKRILYADDDEESCLMMTALLGKELGYEVVTAQAAATALEQAVLNQYDLLVIDNHFPDGAGVDVCKQVRSLGISTPVILYSGTSIEGDLERGLEAGAQAYVLKPYIDELLRSIETLLLNPESST